MREFENWGKLALIMCHENCEILAQFSVLLRYSSICFSEDMFLTHYHQFEKLFLNLKIWKRKLQEKKKISRKEKSHCLLSVMVVDNINSLICFQTFCSSLLFFSVSRITFPRGLFKRVNARTKENTCRKASAECSIVNKIPLWINIKVL